jgi:hypothetical protein
MATQSWHPVAHTIAAPIRSLSMSTADLILSLTLVQPSRPVLSRSLILGGLPPNPRHLSLSANSMTRGRYLATTREIASACMSGRGFLVATHGWDNLRVPLRTIGLRRSPPQASRQACGVRDALVRAGPCSATMLLAQSGKCQGCGGRAPNCHRSIAGRDDL